MAKTNYRIPPPKRQPNLSTELSFQSHTNNRIPPPPTAYLPPPRPKPPPLLSLLADKCTSIHQLKQVHAQMIINARIHDHFAVSRLLSFYALSESGDLNNAMQLFDTIHNPNNFMWNTLIRALINGPNPRKALSLYVKMRRVGVLPNFHTFPFVIKSCTVSRSLELCKQVHVQVLKHGFSLDMHVVNGLVRSYSVSSELDDARRVFDEMPARDLIVWTTMISGYAQNFYANEALLLFDQMVSNGFNPNKPTLASVLSACARSGCLELGEKLHAFMEDKEIEMGLILTTGLVNMYAKNGELSKAEKLFNKMKERNILTWNAMICGLASHGRADEALGLFHELIRKEVGPTDVTFVGVLSACCHAGFVDIGRKMFCDMKRVYGIEPKIEHYGCMVDLLGRRGKVEEAEEMIKGMVWKADVVILGALLAACKKHGNIGVAERVVEEMVELGIDNDGVYVVLSNMYAEVGRWGDVMRLRKVMKRVKMAKTPGWSLVDV